MKIHPRLIDAIVSVLKQDVAEFYMNRPFTELRNPHLELVAALSKRGFPPVPKLMDRIELEAALLAIELEAQDRAALRSTVHTTNKAVTSVLASPHRVPKHTFSGRLRPHGVQ